MKVVFIVPKSDDQHQQIDPLTQCRIFPPIGLARMAGIIGRHAVVSLLDERLETDAQPEPTDIAIIFINSYNQQRACDLARTYQALGCCVVMTGALLSCITDFPSDAADCWFIGSGEDHLARFLSDYQKGKPKQFYRATGEVTSAAQYHRAVDGTPLRLAS
ncbi:MAG: hypothetical protein AMJ55_08840 [Gammaproteobacteria bacterium SG8_15]|nr:MAG: hypothetical protein AMJ55_08840 [Gammaproteobacteria bacterium SG8_15]